MTPLCKPSQRGPLASCVLRLEGVAVRSSCALPLFRASQSRGGCRRRESPHSAGVLIDSRNSHTPRRRWNGVVCICAPVDSRFQSSPDHTQPDRDSVTPPAASATNNAVLVGWRSARDQRGATTSWTSDNTTVVHARRRLIPVENRSWLNWLAAERILADMHSS